MQDGKTETVVGIFVLAALGIFIYMGFQIGAFRFDKAKYNKYNIYFKDISGLSRKAEVKIAGVKVGWVEEITLHANGNMEAQAQVMVLKEFSLYSDSYSIIRQQGLLGPNYLEIIPGDPYLRKLDTGEALTKPSVSPVSMDELLQKFNHIASNVQEVTETLQEALGGSEGRNQMNKLFENINVTAEKMASFSEVLERSFTRNEDNIDDILALGKDLRRLSEKLENDIFPTFKESLDRISNVFDRDFSSIAKNLESTSQAVQEASIQARDGLKSISSVAEKIDEGKGLIGKLINEDETYKDLKIAVGGLKNYFAKTERMQLIFDSHFESMHRPAETYNWEDSKGYFDVRIHPNEDRFYILQIVASEKGFMDRHEILKEYLDENGFPICVKDLDINDADKLAFTYRQRLQILNRDKFKIGIQFGKIFKDTVALRFGLMEGYGGVGIDIDIPFGTDKFRWVTSFEAFDLTGQNKVNDRRPHLKWLNRMYMMRNIYLTFGADDFVSKRNSNVFVGGGIRFGDDDVKFLLGGLGSAASSGSGGGSAFNTGTYVGS